MLKMTHIYVISKAVRRELKASRQLLILCYADVSRKVLLVISAQDAEGVNDSNLGRFRSRPTQKQPRSDTSSASSVFSRVEGPDSQSAFISEAIHIYEARVLVRSFEFVTKLSHTHVAPISSPFRITSPL